MFHIENMDKRIFCKSYLITEMTTYRMVHVIKLDDIIFAMNTSEDKIIF